MCCYDHLHPASGQMIKTCALVPAQESLDSPIDRRSDYYRQRAREQRPPGAAVQQAPLEPQPLLTVPNALTFLRVLLVSP